MAGFKRSIEDINKLNKGTIMEQLGIEYLEAGYGYIKARMPVDERTYQPMGLLHGGANLTMAETLGGIGSSLMVDIKRYDIKGLHVTADHVRSVHRGWVYGEAYILHEGKNIHIWNIDIKNEEGELVSACRITNFIILKKV